ncbi:MAG: ATP-binding protein [Armatimonadetes bacterium]|nr:ATP-binding protein [Armatimonadota bacterium]
MTIAVAAGKGGTGKTLVATSLAVAAAAEARAVQLLDCDVEEPNADLLLRPEIGRREEVTILSPVVDRQACTGCGRCAQECQFSAIAVMRGNVITFPDLCAGCGVCAFVCPAAAIEEVARPIGVVEHGTTAEGVDFWQGQINVGVQRSGPVIRAVKKHVYENRLTIIDCPPGTACPMQESISGADFCLLVTEPTPFGLSDLAAAVETCHVLGVPCGVILNRAGAEDSDASVRDYCQKERLPLLLRIPEERRIAEAYSRGVTLAHAFPEWREDLAGVLEAVSNYALQRSGNRARF